MIDSIRDVIIAKAEASRRLHQGPTPSFAAFIGGLALIGIVIAAGAAI